MQIAPATLCPPCSSPLRSREPSSTRWNFDRTLLSELCGRGMRARGLVRRRPCPTRLLLCSTRVCEACAILSTPTRLKFLAAPGALVRQTQRLRQVCVRIRSPSDGLSQVTQAPSGLRPAAAQPCRSVCAPRLAISAPHSLRAGLCACPNFQRGEKRSARRCRSHRYRHDRGDSQQWAAANPLTRPHWRKRCGE